MNGTDINVDVPRTKKATIYQNSVQLIHEMQEVRNCLLNGNSFLKISIYKNKMLLMLINYFRSQ